MSVKMNVKKNKMLIGLKIKYNQYIIKTLNI